MKTVIPSEHVQASGDIAVIRIMKRNVVWHQELTTWIAKILLEMDGMVDILKSMETNIVMALQVDVRNQFV